MKHRTKTTAWMLASLLAASVAFADLFESGVLNEAIPDNNALGMSDTITVSGMTGVITDISFTLAISGTGYGAYNGDYYAYVRHGDLFAVLLNRVGKTAGNPYGSWDNGFNITFTLTGADIHTAEPTGGILSGEWAADGRVTDPDTVVDTDARTALLDRFLGADANGAWTLFVADLESGGTARIDNWSISIQAVPEPAVMGLISIGGILMLTVRRNFRG